MSLQTVRTQLKSIVDGVKTAQAEISATLDYMPAQITATPLVCIIYDSANEDYATTGQNMLDSRGKCIQYPSSFSEFNPEWFDGKSKCVICRYWRDSKRIENNLKHVKIKMKN